MREAETGKQRGPEMLFGPFAAARRRPPDLEIKLPDRIRVRKADIAAMLEALAHFRLGGGFTDPGPIEKAFGRVCQQVESTIAGGATDESGSMELSRALMRVSCMPDGGLDGFKLKWDEWDIVLGALSWIEKDDSPSLQHANPYAQISGDAENIRDSRISCNRCGIAIHAADAGVASRSDSGSEGAYFCRSCLRSPVASRSPI